MNEEIPLRGRLDFGECHADAHFDCEPIVKLCA